MTIIDKIAEVIESHVRFAPNVWSDETQLLSRKAAQAAWDIVKAEMPRDDVAREAAREIKTNYNTLCEMKAALTTAMQKMEE